LVSPELALFNIEFNTEPQILSTDALSRMATTLQKNWDQARSVAHTMDAELAMIGILPTVTEKQLSPRYISAMNRYHAFNTQVLRLRGGRALQLDIQGNDVLRLKTHHVMLESATTSLQIHLQIPPEKSLRAYNASIITSAPLVAISANSPYLFGKDLWAETRIPLFEQAVEVGGLEEKAHGPMRRVSFGSGYARHSLMEFFTENLEHFPVLLPSRLNSSPQQLKYLRLHNGTLWRWNRPLIAIEETPNGEINSAHVRIEQRVVSAGPTINDAIANAAFYYGLSYALCALKPAPESQLPFATARDNFYHCAQHGLDGYVIWLDGKKHPVQSLLLNVLLPMAHTGLALLGINTADSEKYLNIIEARVKNKLNGANWQRKFIRKYKHNMSLMLQTYLQHQHSAIPVHEWDI
jgi:Glutamate-cysteine ligase family 2(GCS2)